MVSECRSGSKPLPPCAWALLRTCLGFAACGAFHTFMSMHFVCDIESEGHLARTWWQRIGWYYLVGVGVRFKFYFVWLIAEAVRARARASRCECDARRPSRVLARFVGPAS